MQQPRVMYSHPHTSRQLTYAEPLQTQAWLPTHTQQPRVTFNYPYMIQQGTYAESFPPPPPAQAYSSSIPFPTAFNCLYTTQSTQQVMGLAPNGFQSQTPFAMARPSLTVENTSLMTSQAQSGRSRLAQSSVQFVNHTASDFFMHQ